MRPRNQLDSVAAIEFLTTEIDTGMTFARIALNADSGAENIKRNTANARRTYDTVLRFRGRLAMSFETSILLDRELEKLRLCLVDLGQQL